MSDVAGYVAPDPSNVAIRELQRGIVRNIPAQLIPMGAMRDQVNGAVTHGGIKRSVSFVRQSLSGAPEDRDSLEFADVCYVSEDEVETLVFGRRFLYTLGGDGQTLSVKRMSLVFTADSESADLDYDGSTGEWTLTFPAGFDLGKVQVGDILEFDPGSFEISKVLSQVIGFYDVDDLLDPDEDDETTVASVTFFLAFAAVAPFVVQHVSVPGNVFVADRSQRGLLVYNAANGLKEIEFDQGENAEVISEINCLAYHDYRLWLGGMTLDGVRYPGRIIWGKRSSPYDPAFSERSDGEFLDIIGPKTEILRIEALGSLLVCYFGDAVYFGRPTNIVGLPYDFTLLNTGGIGLVGPRALCSVNDGHFFVGQDDVYFLSAAGGLEKIGSAVVDRTIDAYSGSLEHTVVVADPKESRVLFAFRNASGNFDEVWAFNYTYSSWYRMDIAGQSLSQVSRVTSITWDDFPQGVPTDPEWEAPTAADTWEDPAWKDKAWAELMPSTEFARLVVVSDNQMYSPAEGNWLCELRGAAPAMVLESGDMDFGQPDVVKTATRLTVKLESVHDLTGQEDESAFIRFRVETSTNRGRTWKDHGWIVIGVGQDEGKLNFLHTGSMVRFRLTCGSNVAGYKVTEVGLRVRQRGLETVY